MMSITSTRYLSNVDWLQDVVQGTDLILCGVSALEYLELFNGYVNESDGVCCWKHTYRSNT